MLPTMVLHSIRDSSNKASLHWTHAFLIWVIAAVPCLGRKSPWRWFKMYFLVVSFLNETVTFAADHIAITLRQITWKLLKVLVSLSVYLMIWSSSELLQHCPWVFRFYPHVVVVTLLQLGDYKQLRGSHVLVRWACGGFKEFLYVQWPKCISLFLFHILSVSALGIKEVFVSRLKV